MARQRQRPTLDQDPNSVSQDPDQDTDNKLKRQDQDIRTLSVHCTLCHTSS